MQHVRDPHATNTIGFCCRDAYRIAIGTGRNDCRIVDLYYRISGRIDERELLGDGLLRSQETTW